MTPTEDEAYQLLERLRWGQTPVCPHCGVGEPYFLAPKDREGRKTRTGNHTQRGVWKCRSCRSQFSVLVGTMLQGTRVPLRTWVLVVMRACTPAGISAREIQRDFGLSYKTSRAMVARLRQVKHG